MQFEVNRADFYDTRAVTISTTSTPTETSPNELQLGQIRLTVERFALTTNNITYAVAGEMLDYWGFFPADEPGADGKRWGRIPAMGLGSVAESAHPDIAVGGRYFGFYPMATDVVIDATPYGNAFRDVGAHRAEHAATYTAFRDVTADVMFRPEQADEYLLLWGVFMTSFLVDDYLADNNFLDATQTLVTSASSKTSICLAQCLAQRDDHRCIGLTSERNRVFVENLGLYDEVFTYDEVDQLDPTVTSTLVDMAGNASVRSAVHTHFNDALKVSLTVGATHWQESGGGGTLPGPTPEFFFAPGQSAKRAGDWGQSELDARIARSFHRLSDTTDQWLTVEHRTGPDGVESVYRSLLDGDAEPETGYVVTMREDPPS
ncbi:DUF2855 family protein [uncultured Ilumatobacter sp.]|uniref:DUF2855 family protein n=1 Tax=uncultured Ilumatobacter sp. TaxID=879968 RepID=UPI00374F23B6